MVNYKIYMSKSLLLLFVCFLFSVGCKKPATFFKDDTGDENRKTAIKILNADDIIVHALDFNPPTEEFAVMVLSRDPNSQVDLNQPVTVKLVKSPAQIADYNTAHGSAYIELPSSAFTFLDDINNITFAPGEFTKEIRIRLNKGALDLSNQYALGLTIASVGDGAIISSTGDKGLAAILIKNQWDGVYVLTGRTDHPTNAILTGPVGPYEMDLATSGSRNVTLIPTHPWANGSNSTTPAGYNPVFTINANNTVTVTNPNGLGFENAPGYNSRYDPATKTLYVQWRYMGAGGYRVFTDTLVYLRPR